VAAIAVAVAMICFTLVGGWSTPVLYPAVGVVGVAGVVAGILIHRPRRAGPWWLLVAGLLGNVAGDATSAASERLMDEVPFPWVADGLYVVSFPLLAGAIIWIARARMVDADRTSVIDATIVATSAGLLAWVFFMAPASRDSELSPIGQVVSLAYPLWDVLLLALLVRLATAGQGLPSLRLLSAAFSVWLLSDITYAVELRYGAYEVRSPTTAVWLVGYVIFAAAALHPSAREATEPVVTPNGRLTGLRLATLAGVSLVAPALLLAETLAGAGATNGLAIGIASVVLFLLVVLRMAGLVRQVEAQSAQLTDLARLDGLTGIPNRRAWDSELPAAMDRARRDGVPLSVVLLDLDRFKRFNDEYGHQAGDRLLKSATAAWSSALRSVDLMCRYGGEEFVIVMPGATAAHAEAVVERMRAATPLGQTFSAGVARWDGSEVAEALVERADVALYAAKNGGRDRTVTSPAARALEAGRA
jgi:diguanylate cyclase